LGFFFGTFFAFISGKDIYIQREVHHGA